jgi:hypothetical protein
MLLGRRMTTPTAAASPPSRLAAFLEAAPEETLQNVGAPVLAYSATVFVGAWNSSGVRVPSTREQHDRASRCAG